jgi:hypothetical protein
MMPYFQVASVSRIEPRNPTRAEESSSWKQSWDRTKGEPST